MMKQVLLIAFVLSVTGCAKYPVVSTSEPGSEAPPVATADCLGDTELPAALAGKFDAVDDNELLNKTLGEATKGMLCQGKVYQAKSDVNIVLYRAWNSTNPNSQMGKWWAAEIPEGSTAQYRVDYEICYQWSPLDKMTTCHLKAGAKVVVGTGQSATCSPYLTYPTSASKQVYLDDASSTMENCQTFDDKFNWQPTDS